MWQLQWNVGWWAGKKGKRTQRHSCPYIGAFSLFRELVRYPSFGNVPYKTRIFQAWKSQSRRIRTVYRVDCGLSCVGGQVKLPWSNPLPQRNNIVIHSAAKLFSCLKYISRYWTSNICVDYYKWYSGKWQGKFALLIGYRRRGQPDWRGRGTAKLWSIAYIVFALTGIVASSFSTFKEIQKWLALIKQTFVDY